MARTSSFRKYSKLEKTSRAARKQEIFAYIRGVLWIAIGWIMAKGPVHNALETNTEMDSSLVILLSVIAGLLVATILILLDTWISRKITWKPMIRRMFQEVNLSEDLREKALEAFFTKGSPAYGNEYYAYIVASAVKRNDNERKRHNITTEEYKKIVTDLINNIGAEPDRQ